MVTQQQPLSRREGWQRTIWPNVETQEGATWATKQAFWAAVLVSAITGLLAVLGAVGVGLPRPLQFDAGALVDAAAFAAIAFGLWKHSRVAAWAGLVLYCVERAYTWSTVGIQSPVVAAILILAFVGGVRGTSALHRLKQAEVPDTDA